MFPVTLTTERLVLRERTLDDAEFFFELVHNSDAARFQTWNMPTELGAYTELFSKFLPVPNDRDRRYYEMAIEADGELLGYCGLYIENPEHRRAELFYALTPKVWGRGLATESARAMVGFGFDELDLHRIWATAHPDNHSSHRVLQKVGMEYEGRLKSHYFVRGAWRDSVMYAVVRAESS